MQHCRNTIQQPAAAFGVGYAAVFMVGWLVLMRPLKLPPHIITETGKVNLAKELKTLCFAIAPVAANFILITAFNFTAAAAMALVVLQ